MFFLDVIDVINLDVIDIIDIKWIKIFIFKVESDKKDINFIFKNVFRYCEENVLEVKYFFN